jgi:hypothetical protein
LFANPNAHQRVANTVRERRAITDFTIAMRISPAASGSANLRSAGSSVNRGGVSLSADTRRRRGGSSEEGPTKSSPARAADYRAINEKEETIKRGNERGKSDQERVRSASGGAEVDPRVETVWNARRISRSICSSNHERPRGIAESRDNVVTSSRRSLIETVRETTLWQKACAQTGWRNSIENANRRDRKASTFEAEFDEEQIEHWICRRST